MPFVSRELARFQVRIAQGPNVCALRWAQRSSARSGRKRSDIFIAKALSAKCSSANAALLRSLKRFSHKDYRVVRLPTLDVWEHVAIDERRTASEHVRSWLADLQHQDIEGIARVYIIGSDFNRDWLGTYLPGLAVITIAWESRLPPNGWLAALENAINRHTLLHEVGHHAYRHWFGQDPEQEDEANSFAHTAAKYRKPIWLRGARLVLKSLRLIGRA